MQKINKPWGYEIIWAHVNGKYIGKILHIEPGQRLSLQYHIEKDETLFCLKNQVNVEIGLNKQCVYKLAENDTIHIEPNMIHRISVPADWEACDIIEVSTDYLDDVVRLQDDYNR